MNFLLPSVPVEEGRPKLGKRRKLLLGVHHEGVAWNHSTGGALAYNDEPGGGRCCARGDKEKQINECCLKDFEKQQKYLSVVGSGPTRMSGKSCRGIFIRWIMVEISMWAVGSTLCH